MNNRKFAWVWYAVAFIVGIMIGTYLSGGFNNVAGQTGNVLSATGDSPSQGINE